MHGTHAVAARGVEVAAGTRRRSGERCCPRERPQHRRAPRRFRRLKRLGVVSERAARLLPSTSSSSPPPPQTQPPPPPPGRCHPLHPHPLSNDLLGSSVGREYPLRRKPHPPYRHPRGADPTPAPFQPPAASGGYSTRINGSYWVVFNACCAQLVATGFSVNVESLDVDGAYPPPDEFSYRNAEPARDGAEDDAAVDADVDSDSSASTRSGASCDGVAGDEAADCVTCMTVLVSPTSSPLPLPPPTPPSCVIASSVPHMRRCADSDSESSLSHSAPAAVAAAARSSIGNVAPVLTTQRGGAARYAETGTASQRRCLSGCRYLTFSSFQTRLTVL